MSLPKVLFIININKADLIQKQKKSTLKYEEVKNKIIYSNIPSRTILRNDIGCIITSRCWQCDLDFTGIEIFFPRVIEENKFLAEGYFNSFKCLLSYVKLHYGSSTDEIESINKANFLLKKLQEKFPQKKFIFEPAISKYIMEKYGGVVSEDDYRNLVE